MAPSRKTPGTRRVLRRTGRSRAAKEPKLPSREQAGEVLEQGAKQVTPSDVETVIKKSKKIESTFRSAGPLGRFLDELRLLLSVVRDYRSGVYRKIPYYSIAAIVAALLYVLNPLDLVPDFIPGLGYIDDALVISTCLAMIRRDLRVYREWLGTKGR